MIRAVRGNVSAVYVTSVGVAPATGSTCSRNVPLGWPRVRSPPDPLRIGPSMRTLLGTVPGTAAAAARHVEPLPGAAECMIDSR